MLTWIGLNTEFPAEFESDPDGLEDLTDYAKYIGKKQCSPEVI